MVPRPLLGAQPYRLPGRVWQTSCPATQTDEKEAWALLIRRFSELPLWDQIGVEDVVPCGRFLLDTAGECSE